LEGINIVFTSPFQFINLAITCGLTTGLVIAFPYFVAQVMLYLKPAMKQKEYKILTRLIPLFFILFVFGFGFGAIIMKWQIEIFLARSIALGIGNILDISGLLTVVFLTSALMGIGFQFPLILLALIRLGVITRENLKSKRKWIYLGSFIFTLFLPPDSVIADIILTLPLIFLFEFTLILDLIVRRRK
jgi:sec-independent protein translocase protein TatC